MARWKPFPIVGGAYKDDARPWSAQDTLNYLVVMAERPGGRSPSLLRGVPGLRSMAIPQEAPIRGLHNAEGLLCAVVGDTFYTIAGDGGVTAHGTIPGVGRVSMAHNQVTYGNQIAIANGMSGYVYDTTTGELTHITDEGFPGSISFGFVDGYITGIEPGRRFAFFSQLADATSYNTLDRLEAESKPDRLVGQAISHREWWLFGERTIELYQNTGAATGTFQRAEGVAIEVGCASGDTIVNLDNSIFWLGNDGIVYRANGYTPERISTHAIEQDISRCNMAQAFACSWVDRGHAVYYLTFPDGHTWGYDAASGEWHRRQSEDMDRWRINDVVRWNNQWIAGDFSNGTLYVMDWDRQDENGAVLERRRTTGVLADSQNAVIVNGLELVIDTGQPGAQNLKLYGSLGALTVGEAVDFQYRTEGGSSPVALSILSGSLPDGLTMDSQGHVTGTPTTTGDYMWTVQAVDALGQVATLDDEASVAYQTLEITGTFPDAKVNVSYSEVIQITGGEKPYSNLRVTDGALPDGLSLSLQTDVIRLIGTPTGIDPSVSFTVAVDSTDGQTAFSAQEMRIGGAFTYAAGTQAGVGIFGYQAGIWHLSQTINLGSESTGITTTSDGTLMLCASSGGSRISAFAFQDIYSGFFEITNAFPQVPPGDILSIDSNSDGSIVVVGANTSTNSQIWVFERQANTWDHVQTIDVYGDDARCGVNASGTLVFCVSSQNDASPSVYSLSGATLTEMQGALPSATIVYDFSWHPTQSLLTYTANPGNILSTFLSVVDLSQIPGVEKAHTTSNAFYATYSPRPGLSALSWSKDEGRIIWTRGTLGNDMHVFSYDGSSLTEDEVFTPSGDSNFIEPSSQYDMVSYIGVNGDHGMVDTSGAALSNITGPSYVISGQYPIRFIKSLRRKQP